MNLICASGLCVAAELDIPSYFFITSAACFLAFILYFPTLHQSYTESFRHMKDFLDIPSLPPILATEVPKPCLDRDNKAWPVYFLDVASQFPQVARIMINTFELLESKAVKAISDGLCVPNIRTSPISCIGGLTRVIKANKI